MEPLTKSNVFSYLNNKKDEVFTYWNKNCVGNGVTSYSKLLLNGNVEHHVNAGCHYYARYTNAYAGLITTTYVNGKFPCFSFREKSSHQYAVDAFNNENNLYAWWVEFLLSVINDPDSYYNRLKDFVKVEYDKENRPLAWLIDGNAPHVCMTSFLVCTRKSKEKITPLFVYYLKEKFPELGPMEALSVAEIICKRIDSRLFKLPKDVRIPFEVIPDLKFLMKSDSHVHCAQFHPNLHNPNGVLKIDPRTNHGYTKHTNPTHEMLGKENWSLNKEALDFKDWINNYGNKEIDIKPLFHKIRDSDKASLIPLDKFVARFQKFLMEINKK